ncbi:MAG: hypothetical protein LBR74_10390 [Eubacterium sp.]|jgi:hypothetical protein|nr:hypothetical protein [Eubacterium sp.]
MDEILKFLQSKKAKITLSFVSVGYALFLVWLAWLTYSHYLRPTNGPALFFFFVLINLLFGAIMLYTRRRLVTKISSCFFHPIILVILFLGFGNWYLAVPPFLVATVIFFASRTGESLKTVLGTIYLIFYVIGVIGYLTLQEFSIKLFDVDLSLRDENYDYSSYKTYRVVRYIDPPSKENRIIKFYVEKANEDIHLPFLNCEKFYDAEIILTARYSKMPDIRWMDDNTLIVDGKVKNVAIKDDGESDDTAVFSGETSIIT